MDDGGGGGSSEMGSAGSAVVDGAGVGSSRSVGSAGGKGDRGRSKKGGYKVTAAELVAAEYGASGAAALAVRAAESTAKWQAVSWAEAAGKVWVATGSYENSSEQTKKGAE